MTLIASAWDRFGVPFVPVALVSHALGVVWLVWRTPARIRSGWTRSDAWRAGIAEVALVSGTAPWVALILTPSGHGRDVRLIPFRDLVEVGAGSDWVVQMTGNLLALAALGFFLPVRFRLAPARFVPFAVLGVAAGVSLVLESAQWAFAMGRVSSVDDVLVNALGAALASLLSVRWWVARRPFRHARHPSE